MSSARRATLAALLAAVVAACSGGGGGHTPGPVPVTVAEAKSQTVPVDLHEVGHVEASSTVSVRAQVTGELRDVAFTEGDHVKAGDRLFTIDPRPYKAALDKAQATLDRDRAQATQAREEAARYQTLASKSYVSKEQLAKLQAASDGAAAAVRADEAAVRAAKLDLDHCTIRAPIDGRTGRLLVHAGNLVRANDAALVVINKLKPVQVTFGVPEQFLPKLLARSQEEQLVVKSSLTRDSDETRTGLLSFIDNTVDPSTGMVTLKATFPNDDEALWPGQFTDVVLTLSQEEGAIVVPTQAVQDGQQGNYVFVVKGDAVDSVPVEVERTAGRLSVIHKGLQAGDIVVTDGQLLLRSGSKVTPKPTPEGS